MKTQLRTLSKAAVERKYMTTTTIPQVKTPVYVAPERDDELDCFVLYARVGKAA